MKERLLAALPDASVYVRLPHSVSLVMAPRRDGLLHVRHLDSARYPEELLCVPDLTTRPQRGFWSDAVMAAARDAAGSAEIVAGYEGDTGVCELVLATRLLYAAAPDPGDVAAVARALGDARADEAYVGDLLADAERSEVGS